VDVVVEKDFAAPKKCQVTNNELHSSAQLSRRLASKTAQIVDRKEVVLRAAEPLSNVRPEKAARVRKRHRLQAVLVNYTVHWHMPLIGIFRIEA
jgi:hypothetical protein